MCVYSGVQDVNPSLVILNSLHYFKDPHVLSPDYAGPRCSMLLVCLPLTFDLFLSPFLVPPNHAILLWTKEIINKLEIKSAIYLFTLREKKGNRNHNIVDTRTFTMAGAGGVERLRWLAVCLLPISETVNRADLVCGANLEAVRRECKRFAGSSATG